MVRQKAILSLAVVCIMCFLGKVYGDCPYSLKNLTDALEITEEDKDVAIVDIPSELGLRWNFSIISFDDSTPSPDALKDLNTFFTVNVTNTWLTIMLIIKLDKEYFYNSPFYQQKTVHLLHTRLICTDTDNSRTRLDLTIINDPVNEYRTSFLKPPFVIKVAENIAVGTPVFVLTDHITDEDHPVDRNNITFRIFPYKNAQVNGADFFQIGFLQNGSASILLKKEIDFDELYKRNKNEIPFYKINITVDDGIHNQDTTYLTINILDVDDMPPGFVYPSCRTSCPSTPYRAYTSSSYRGVLTVFPVVIRAVDRDSLNYAVEYSIVEDPNSYYEAFSIDPDSGEVQQINNITRTGVLIIKATEKSPNQFYETATLLIKYNNDSLLETEIPHTIVNQPSATSTSTEKSTPQTTIIVGVIALVIIIVLLLVLLWFHRKFRRAVSPNYGVEEEQNEDEDKGEQLQDKMGSKELLMDPTLLLTPNGKFKDMSTETEVIKKKRPRRKKKEKEPEIYDGTRDYDMSADLSFFANTDKKIKIKQSTRSKNAKTDPKYWITVPNED